MGFMVANNNPTGINQYSKGTAGGRAARKQKAMGIRTGREVAKGRMKQPFGIGTSNDAYRTGYHLGAKRKK